MRIPSLAAVLVAVLCLMGMAGKADAGLFISVGIAPPPLPVYVQPPIPGPGYIWTPGYWAWDGDVSDYYWVPGAWVPAPEPGLLWTPGYWAWNDGAYVWNAGYWGPHVGFYGGVCYGFGYTGVGFAGGYWSGGSFYYNRSVTNISNTTIITNVYSKTVVNNNSANVSFNGVGGIKAHPTQHELEAANQRRLEPTKEQFNHQKLASQNQNLRASVNGGKPPVAAVRTAGDFSPKSAIAPKAGAGSVKPVSLNGPDANHGTQHQAGTVPGGKNHTGHNAVTTSNGPGGAKPFNNNAAAQHLNGGPGARPFNNAAAGHPFNGTPGPNPFNPGHGPGMANLNPGGPNNRPNNMGPNGFHPNGAPPRGGAAFKAPPGNRMPQKAPPRPGPQPGGQQHKNDQQHG